MLKYIKVTPSLSVIDIAKKGLIKNWQNQKRNNIKYYRKKNQKNS